MIEATPPRRGGGRRSPMTGDPNQHGESARAVPVAPFFPRAARLLRPYARLPMDTAAEVWRRAVISRLSPALADSNTTSRRGRWWI